MSDDQYWYLEREPKPNLYSWIFKHMAVGAAYGALVLMGAVFFILIFKALSFLLPEDPFAALDTGTRLIGAIV